MFELSAPRAPLTAADIRALYERNASAETSALAWEVWRLQRVLLGLERAMHEAARMGHRQQMVERLYTALSDIEHEPYRAEAKPIKPGEGRKEPPPKR